MNEIALVVAVIALLIALVLAIQVNTLRRRLNSLPADENLGAAWNFNRLVDATSAPYFCWSPHDDERDRGIGPADEHVEHVVLPTRLDAFQQVGGQRFEFRSGERNAAAVAVEVDLQHGLAADDQDLPRQAAFNGLTICQTYRLV